MPNWCSNTLIVTPKNSPEGFAQLKDFKDNILSRKDDKDERGDSLAIFNLFIPMPPELRNGDGWYNWSVENWGTKWDIYYSDVTFEDDDLQTDDRFQMWFDTAWSPPIPFIAAISKDYDLLEFKLAFSEGGCAFAGYHTWCNGRLIEEYEVKEFYRSAESEDDEFDDYTVAQEWNEFMCEYGLHEGG